MQLLLCCKKPILIAINIIYLFINPLLVTAVQGQSSHIISETLPHLDDSEIKDSILSDMLNMVDNIDNPNNKATLLNAFASKYIEIGEENLALSILQQVKNLIINIKSKKDKVNILQSLAVNYTALKQDLLALEILSESLILIDEIKDDQVKEFLLSQIALNYLDLGEYKKVEELIAQSKNIIVSNQEEKSNLEDGSDNWDISFNIGGGFTNTASTTQNFNIGTNIQKQGEKDYFETNVNFAVSFDSTRKSNDQTRLTLVVDPLIYKNLFTDTWFYFLGGFAEKFDADKIYFRSLAYSGLGFNLWHDDENNTADFLLGLGYRYEDADGKRAVQEFPTISVGLFHKNIIFSNWELTQQITYDIPVENSDNSFGLFTNQLRIPFSEQWSLNTFFRLSYFAQPADSDSTLNTSFLWGIQYTFK